MEERWIMHYSSAHDILLIGEGDFSFSACLARAFGSAHNIVATSLDSQDALIRKYRNAILNLTVLYKRGASVLHGVDATKMCLNPNLRSRKFYRIIYNLPHVGFYGKEDNPELIKMHQELVSGFFANAKHMLWPGGEIHVSHKTKDPYNLWEIEKLASSCSLSLVECVDFKTEDYPGYQNKRGAGSDCDESFAVDDCKTFKFRDAALHVQQHYQPVLVERQPQFPPFASYYSDRTPVLSPFVCNTTDECSIVFGGYLNHIEETFGINPNYNFSNSVSEALRVGYETYMVHQGNSLSGYVDILEELYNWSSLRSDWLKQTLSRLG